MGSNRAKTLRSYLMYTPLVKLDKVYDHIEVQPYILANLMSTGGIWFFSLVHYPVVTISISRCTDVFVLLLAKRK